MAESTTMRLPVRSHSDGKVLRRKARYCSTAFGSAWRPAAVEAAFYLVRRRQAALLVA